MNINSFSDVVMVGNDHDLSKDKRIHLQSHRIMSVSIDVLGKDDNVIQTLEGLATNGSISISGNSSIRRTGSIELALTDDVRIGEDSAIWLENKIRVYISIKDNATKENEFVHYCIGTFYIDNASMNYTRDSNVISLTLSDYMVKWDDTQLSEALTIEADTPIHIAMLSLMNEVGEFNCDIAMSNLTVPYDLEFTMGSKVIDAISKIRDLYMDYDCYYTVDGIFKFEQMKIQIEGEEEPKWDFGKGEDLMISIEKSTNFRNVKNSITVLGKTDEYGNTVFGSYSIQDSDNPFSIENIGERLKVVTESSLFKEEQCEAQAVYELFKSANLAEGYTITTVPIYFLEAKDIVNVWNKDSESYDQVLIDTISYSFGKDSTMSISGSKMYYNIYNVNKIPIEKYRALADVLVNNIVNNGWLSIPEKAIEQAYGMTGRGWTNVRLRFQYQEQFGVMAYVQAYLKTTEQTLVIDLADFENIVDENGGQEGIGKGDYLDRVIGHEVLHIIMNTYLGTIKTSTLPEWYKEGLAELLHGADERLKLIIANDNNSGIDGSKATALVKRASNLVGGNILLSAVTEDYGASYLACKMLAKKVISNKDSLPKMHERMKESKLKGEEALNEEISKHFGSTIDFANYIEKEGLSFINNMALNFGRDEVDTGSILGSDFGGSNLNAEKVFDNSKAEKGVLLKNFNVIIEKP